MPALKNLLWKGKSLVLFSLYGWCGCATQQIRGPHQAHFSQEDAVQMFGQMFEQICGQVFRTENKMRSSPDKDAMYRSSGPEESKKILKLASRT